MSLTAKMHTDRTRCTLRPRSRELQTKLQTNSSLPADTDHHAAVRQKLKAQLHETVTHETVRTDTATIGLENRCTLAGTVGSNPTPSASFSHGLRPQTVVGVPGIVRVVSRP